MSERKRNRQKPAGPFNWLEKLDQEARTLPRAEGWLGPYGLFMLARYPDLRPQPLLNDGHSKIACESGERTADRLFEEYEAGIAGNADTANCLMGLDAVQRRQLAALMLEIESELEIRPTIDHTAKWASQLRREAEARIRTLNRKVEKARRAIEELKEYALDSDTVDTRKDSLHTARKMLGFPYMNAINKALSALEVRFFPNAQEQIELVENYEAPEGPEAFGMVRLYWFLRYGCSINGDEAEVRTALLRNAFWTKHSVCAVKYRAEYIVGQSRGCEAVHVAVWRFRP